MVLNKRTDLKKRLIISILAGILFCTGGDFVTKERNPVNCETIAKDQVLEKMIIHEPYGVMAWWGTMYPQFCFGESNEKSEIDAGRKKVKISLWVAKLFGQC